MTIFLIRLDVVPSHHIRYASFRSGWVTFQARENNWVGFQYSHWENSLYWSCKREGTREGTRERKINGQRKGMWLCVMLWQTGHSTDTLAQWSGTQADGMAPILSSEQPPPPAWMHPASQYFSSQKPDQPEPLEGRAGVDHLYVWTSCPCLFTPVTLVLWDTALPLI